MPNVNNYSYRPPKQRRSRPLKLIACVLVLCVVVVVSGIVLLKRNASVPTSSSSSVGGAKDNIVSIQAKYLFSGTVVPARGIEEEARRSDGTIDYNEPFSQLNSFNPEQYDAWVVDLECPVTTSNLSFREQVATTIFNCRPEFLPAMSKYFTHVNLANNHVYDRGKDRFVQMQQFIQDAGIQHVGNQDPSVTKDVCEVMAMKVNLKQADGKTGEGTLPIAFCAWHYFERPPKQGEFDVMKQYAEIMPVFGLMQVGVEYVAQADSRQESVGRAIIDGGAEFVIGNSPHWVQNSDVYNNKLIFYSTGNFIFDQLDVETNRGASVEVEMTLPYDDNLGKWLALGEVCKQHYDNCLQKAKEQKLAKIRPTFRYGLVASTTGYRQLTKKADARTQAAIEARANWQKTLQQIGQQ